MEPAELLESTEKAPVDLPEQYVSISLEIDAPTIRHEPEDWIVSIKTVITQLADDDQSVNVGTIRAFLVQVAQAQTDGLFTTYEVVDSYYETAYYLGLLERGSWTEYVQEHFDAVCQDLLVLDRIEILPEYRGRGIGLLALRALIDLFSQQCGLVVCKPFPLQFEGFRAANGTALPRTKDKEKAFQQARRKLIRYWSRLGFRTIPQSDILALDPAYRMPSPKQMLRGIGTKRSGSMARKSLDRTK